jgi:hypothetical protein
MIPENTMSRFTKLGPDFMPLPADATGHPFVLDSQQNLIFTVEHLSTKRVDHETAEKLAADCALGGATDWRLPTVEELFLVCDRSKHDPAIDTDAFPGTKSDWYWTATRAAWDAASAAWFVDLSGGDAGNGRRGSGAFVRAVRSGVPSGQ